MLTDISDILPLIGFHWEDLSNHDQDDVLMDYYIPISKRDFLNFAQNDTSFYISQDKKTIFTCTIRDDLFAIVPLKPKYENEILQLSQIKSL